MSKTCNHCGSKDSLAMEMLKDARREALTWYRAFVAAMALWSITVAGFWLWLRYMV